jgi:heme A synthase
MKVVGFARFAWAVLAYNLGVIAWGAYVRASVSGAGCGAHWPLCDGRIAPRPRSVEMMIELFHRLTSGMSLALAVAVLVAAFRAYPRRHVVRRGAIASLSFMLAEALVGAGLVLFGLVARDPSTTRALSMSLHLVNTFLLLAAMTLTAWWASGGARVRLRKQGVLAWVLGAALAGMLFLGTSGAVAALGDTVFPARSHAEGFAQDVSAGAHLFLRLRVVHPFLATVSAGAIVGAAVVARALRPRSARVHVAARVVTVLFAAQYGAGLLNVALLAPVWMQIVHLVLADAVWIALVILAASALDERREARAAAPLVGLA